MRKSEALRLREGDQVAFGDDGRTARMSQVVVGTVCHVTQRGGVLVGPPTTNSFDKNRYASIYRKRKHWIPYHYICRKVVA